VTPRSSPTEPARSLPQHWFQVLLALADRSRHGLGIIEEVGRQTDGQVQLWPGMLYVALRKMSDEGLVTETDPPAGFTTGGGRPRFYKLTALGRKACAAEAERMSRLIGAARAKRILKEPA
jgi:DNA-binding PadR family transcriptional regulator